MSEALVQEITRRLRAERHLQTAALHRIRREFSRRIRDLDGASVLAIADGLLATSGVPGARMTAYGLLGHHSAALAALDAAGLERLAGRLDSWGDVDMFACLLAGRAWRDGAITSRTLQRWARSPDRFWRRAALAATVPLNVKSQGGAGDVDRTLLICGMLIDDRDDLVVKALSWALRELAVREPKAVEVFMAEYDARLAARVRREVRNKLATGLKNPGSKAARSAPTSHKSGQRR